jgi:hypothetical protein
VERWIGDPGLWACCTRHEKGLRGIELSTVRLRDWDPRQASPAQFPPSKWIDRLDWNPPAIGTSLFWGSSEW